MIDAAEPTAGRDGAELRRVLYVDDDPDIREIATLALSDVAGLEVAVCGSGAEALAIAPGFQPQLILLDVMMPVMDGPTTLLGLRAVPDLATVPAVFLTAKVQPSEVDRYLGLGAAAVIPKPFDPITLGDQLREIWAHTAP